MLWIPRTLPGGGGMSSDLPAQSLEQTGVMYSWYPTFLQASADIRIPHSCLRRKPMFEGPTLRSWQTQIQALGPDLKHIAI